MSQYDFSPATLYDLTSRASIQLNWLHVLTRAARRALLGVPVDIHMAPDTARHIILLRRGGVEQDNRGCLFEIHECYRRRDGRSTSRPLTGPVAEHLEMDLASLQNQLQALTGIWATGLLAWPVDRLQVTRGNVPHHAIVLSSQTLLKMATDPTICAQIDRASDRELLSQPHLARHGL